MSLSEKLLEVTPPSYGLPCGISEVKKQMSEKDLEALDSAMLIGKESPKRLSNRQIQQVLISEGYEVAYSSISLHRRQQCRCFTGKSRNYKENSASKLGL
jgi:hypothetical protein